jgi:hypothetical protein
MARVQVSGLTKKYGAFQVMHGVSSRLKMANLSSLSAPRAVGNLPFYA